MERKKLIELLSSLFIAFLFLSSYGLIGASSNSQSKTNESTTSVPATIYASAFANASIANYSSIFYAYSNCTGKYAGMLNSTLQKLEQNGSIANYYQSFGTYTLQAGNMSTAQLISVLRSINSSCMSFSATARLALPERLAFYFPSLNQTHVLSIPQSLRYFSLQMPVNNSESSISVAVSALVEPNGTIYSMSITRE